MGDGTDRAWPTKGIGRKCVEDCESPVGQQGGRDRCSKHLQAYLKWYDRQGLPRPPAPSVARRHAALHSHDHRQGQGVDAATEVLTTQGWQGVSEVRAGQSVYVLDLDAMAARFAPLLAVDVRQATGEKMRHVEVGGFSAMTTLHHSWPIRYRRSNGHNRYVNETAWTTMERLRAKNGVYRVPSDVAGAMTRTYSDAFVELVAWTWNEGCIDWGHSYPRIGIAQSHTANPHKCATIARALESAFPGGWCRTVSHKYGRTDYSLNKAPSAAIRAVLGQDKAPVLKFVHSLTPPQLHLFIDTCMAGDGHTTDSGVRRWAQVSMHSIRTFEMVCALAGVPTNTRFKAGERYDSHHGRDGHQVSLLRTRIAHPIDSLAELTSGRRKGGRVVAIDTLVDYDGPVWCPITGSGTWLARRNGSVYFTGGSASERHSG